MKKIILTIAILATSLVSAQNFYVAVAAGPTYAAGEKKLADLGEFPVKEGSFGKGWEGQLRGGYLFNEKFGVELGFGYLYGDEATVLETPIAKIYANTQAYGASLTGVYNFTKNIYVRAGLLTKIAGKTVVDGEFNLQKLGIMGETKFERDNHGKFPLGFTGVFGVKYEIVKNLEIFAEMEYQGINVTGNNSEFVSGTFNGQKVSSYSEFNAIYSQLPEPIRNILYEKKVPQSFADEITYVEGTPDPSKFEDHASDSPYSSFGFNFGLVYHFKWGSKK